MKSVTLHEAAEAELVDALDYYDRQRAGLGGELLREFEKTVERIRANPHAYAVEDDAGTRFAPLRRFPYHLVYVEQNDRLWVAAVAHHRRRPRYWRGRRPS